jgi:hypothetical protein
LVVHVAAAQTACAEEMGPRMGIMRLNILRELGMSERSFEIASIAHQGPEIGAALERLATEVRAGHDD